MLNPIINKLKIAPKVCGENNALLQLFNDYLDESQCIEFLLYFDFDRVKYAICLYTYVWHFDVSKSAAALVLLFINLFRPKIVCNALSSSC